MQRVRVFKLTQSLKITADVEVRQRLAKGAAKNFAPFTKFLMSCSAVALNRLNIGPVNIRESSRE